MSIINLLPDDYIKRRQDYRSNVICIGLMVCVLIGVLSAIMLSQRGLGNTQKVMDQVNNEYSDATRRMAELQALDQQKQGLTAKAQMTAQLLERVPRSYLLASVTNALPSNGSLVSLELYPKRVVVAANVPKKGSKDAKFASRTKGKQEYSMVVEMELTGMASTDVEVSSFITNLQNNPLSASVDLVYSQEKTLEIKDSTGVVVAKPAVREFQVRVVLRSDVDVIDILGKNTVHAEADTKAPAPAKAGVNS